MEDVTEAFIIVIILLGLIFVAIISDQSELNFSYDCKNKKKPRPFYTYDQTTGDVFDRINL